MTAHYAVLDTNAGMLQWIGTAESEADALAKLAIEANEPELGTDELHVFTLTAEEADEVLDWWENGAPSSKCPACIS